MFNCGLPHFLLLVLMIHKYCSCKKKKRNKNRKLLITIESKNNNLFYMHGKIILLLAQEAERFRKLKGLESSFEVKG